MSSVGSLSRIVETPNVAPLRTEKGNSATWPKHSGTWAFTEIIRIPDV